MTSVKISEHQNNQILACLCCHVHIRIDRNDCPSEQSVLWFCRKSKNKKKMHVLELGFLCSNFFKLYFYRFAWDLSSVQTSNAFGQKVLFPWQLHFCSGEILSIKCFLLQCILLLSYFCLKEYDRLEWVLDIKTFVKNIFCKYMYHSFKNT